MFVLTPSVLIATYVPLFVLLDLLIIIFINHLVLLLVVGAVSHPLRAKERSQVEHFVVHLLVFDGTRQRCHYSIENHSFLLQRNLEYFTIISMIVIRI